METSKLNLFVFDTKDNFQRSKKNFGPEGSAFKRIICIEDIFELRSQLDLLLDDEFIFMVVHVFYTDNINGIKRFAASGIEKKFPSIGFMYISEGDGKEINKQMIDAELTVGKVYKYHQVQSSLEDDLFLVYQKKDVINPEPTKHISHSLSDSNIKDFDADTFQCDYAIITALEESEMEKVLPMITKIGRVENDIHLIEYGHLISNPSKTIAYASQLSTGMVDASILSTELILRFNPKFLIMAGVLGGKPSEVNIGDVVVAGKVFTIDKGKISDCGFKIELETINNDNAYITSFKREKVKIIEYIKINDQTRDNRINIHFGSIACVRQVINLEGFFEKNISSVDRKSLALEMESYGVSRACELVNGKKTKPLIIKSAMDNTKDKVDDAKSYAAWTSAMFVRYILEKDLI